MPKQTGEQLLQEKYNTSRRAVAFYNNQVLDHLNLVMQEFIRNQEMVFISTSDRSGHCDSSFRAGPTGFVRIIGESTVMYPEYRGNGVMASMGNITENPHIGLMFIDFFESKVGLHVNGKAYICENKELETLNLPSEVLIDIESKEDNKAERWIVIEIEEAFIHCSKHIPELEKRNKISDMKNTGGDFFKVKQSKIDSKQNWI
ncbi:pyridoxamine 5'-phosphate oxidase family protein [Alkalihalobacillus deserti]|uniref:pyridoxamine 5'-phosphate oxidase family protein n=1 Tax=Alkalihalobacillus deserti TaxID=2879466 RepID=UPI001D15CFC6|nr:pyridoxamine 5'-phosphate oxidase family protein [Alkalihalobacillus deserti]